MPSNSAFRIKDNGTRIEWPSGMQREPASNAARFDLTVPLDLPYEEQMLTRFARHMALGAKKYSDRNWEKASGTEEYHRFRESAFRHFFQWICQVDDGEDHAAAVYFNIMGAEYVKSRINHSDEEE